MALVVETGAGLADAQSYASVEAATAYHAAHGNAAWALAVESDQEAALVRATAFLDGSFGCRWPGERYSQDQALDWPRCYAWDRDGWPLADVPKGIVAATCEAALIELASPGALSKKNEVGLKSLTVGSISKTWTGASAAAATAYPAIRQALARIIKGGHTVARG